MMFSSCLVQPVTFLRSESHHVQERKYNKRTKGKIMGNYLNPGPERFKMALNSQIYVDKTEMIQELNCFLNTEQRFVCVSRPRRFGKTMAANMICAYYDRTGDPEVFQNCRIFREDGMRYQGRFDVLRINMQEFLSRTSSVKEMIDRLEKRITGEIRRSYPDVVYFDPDHLPDVLEDVYDQTEHQFVIVIDEWDCIFREYPHDHAAQKLYLDYLRDWLKDKSYVALAYMTGILPIKKYGTHSALNMFTEFSMENPGRLAEFVGFTEEETKKLCDRYHMDFNECRMWYDGYQFPYCSHVYSPKSVVDAMLSGIFDDYWNKTETYDALKIYIDMNYDGLRDAIITMIAGGKVKIDTGSFENDMTTFHTADDVLTLLIHLGYLGYDIKNKEVFIPNHEILQEFITATTVSQWDEIIHSVRNSDHLLQDTWNMNEEAVAEGVQKAHLETSHIQYNDENALSYTISLAYYAARQYYTMIRELPSGNGFADIVFLPRRRYADKPAMVVELKWNKDAETAIRQIQEKNYPQALKEYHGNILLVGINYDRKTRQHRCIIQKDDKES